MEQFSKLNNDLNIIQTLSDEPNDTGAEGLSPDELKAKFDEAANIIKTWINITHLAELALPTAADMIGFDDTDFDDISAVSVQEAIAALYESMRDITQASVADGAITSAKLANGSVTHTKLAANAVEAGNIKDSEVGTSKLASKAVTTDKINDGAVGTAQLGAGAVTADKIPAGAVTVEKIAGGAVTAAKLAADAVETAKIKDGAVSAAKIANSAVTPEKTNVWVERTVQLPEVSGTWTGASAPYTTTVTVSNVTITHVFVEPALTSRAEYSECNVVCASESNGVLTFTADKVPENTLLVKLLIWGVATA